MNDILLKRKLLEINQIVEARIDSEPNLGVLAGLSGLALFQFHLSKYLDTNTYSERAVNTISNCINKINNGYTDSTFCSGLAGFGWVLDHLNRSDFLDAGNDDFLQSFDEYLYRIMLLDVGKGYYDFLHGSLGYAFYFLTRYDNTRCEELRNRYKKYLFEFIARLKANALVGSDGTFRWLSAINPDSKEKIYNLGLSHGMASIIGLLLKLYEQIDFRSNVEDMLLGTLKYILGFKSSEEEAFSLFPSWVTQNGEHDGRSRLAWCYGDLGIGIQILKASRVLENSKYEALAEDIFRHSARRTSAKNSLVKDASICHGAFGNALIFNRVYRETRNEHFKEACEYWLQEGLDMATHREGYAGYRQWRGDDKKWSSEVSVLEGISGIGLTIISVLADFETNWDECLMLQ